MGFVWNGDKMVFGDPTTNRLGYWDINNSLHYGDNVTWDIKTQLVYPEGKRAIVDKLELVALLGRNQNEASVRSSFSVDGIVWSQERQIVLDRFNRSTKRLAWFRDGLISQWRIQRFSGDSSANLSILRLEVEVSPLVY